MIFHKEICERHEGDTTFLSNHKFRTFMWISGDNIKKYLRLKRDSSYLSTLYQYDTPLLVALYECKIIDCSLDEKVVSQQKHERLRQLTGSRIATGSKFAPIRILWEVTRKCNLNCKYCHSPSKELVQNKTRPFNLPIESLLHLASKIVDANVFEVTLSGGECLLLGDDIFKIINYLRTNNVATSIISNGILLTQNTIKRLKNLDVSVAISLDTYSETRQSITRGKGTFSAAVNAIKEAVHTDVKLNVICTLTRHNLNDLDIFFQFLKRLGVNNVVVQNLIPTTDLLIYNDLQLTKQQEIELISLLPRLLTKYRDMFIETTEVDFFSNMMFDQSIFKKGEFVRNNTNNLMGKSCSACNTAIFLDYTGTVYPCTSLRMLAMGSLLESDLISLWMFSENAKFVRELKSKTSYDLTGCTNCSFIDTCPGGCRGEAFMFTNSWYGRHPRCLKNIL